MYITFSIKGKQYSLTQEENQTLDIDYQGNKNFKPGDSFVINEISSYDGEFGRPFLTNIKIISEVIKHGQRKKIIVYKYKPKKRYKKKQGHRARYTRIKIIRITKSSN